MIYKLNKSTLETYSKSIDGISPFAIFLLKEKANALLNRILIPDNLIEELDQFTKRNNCTNASSDLHSTCPHCLKAHAMTLAKEFGLDKEATEQLDKILEGQIGHDGYYLDEDELIKLN